MGQEFPRCETFEKNAAELDLAKTINTNDIDPNAEPINILVIGK